MTHRVKARNIGQVLLRVILPLGILSVCLYFGVPASDTQFDAGISKAIGTDPLVCLVCGLSADAHQPVDCRTL